MHFCIANVQSMLVQFFKDRSSHPGPKQGNKLGVWRDFLGGKSRTIFCVMIYYAKVHFFTANVKNMVHIFKHRHPHPGPGQDTISKNERTCFSNLW